VCIVFRKRADLAAITGLVLVGIVFVVVLVLLMRPAITGYSVYRELQQTNVSVQDYSQDFAQLEILLNDRPELKCPDMDKTLLAEIEKYADKATACQRSLAGVESNASNAYALYQFELSRFKDDLRDAKKELQAKQFDAASTVKQASADFDELAQNVANNLCCKQRVDNPAISHFRVEDNMIVCLEKGTKSIDCS